MIRGRAISVSDVVSYNPQALAFTGAWLASFGRPELGATWLIWGESANGKTRFALQLAKYMAGFTRVAYNSLEEGMSLSMKLAFDAIGMQDVKRRIVLYDKEPIAALVKRLEKPRSPGVVIIDSVQYSGLKYSDYVLLVNRFRTKSFVFISHSDGKLPAGRVARSIRFDASLKVRVEGFRAFALSRFGGGAPFDIWPEGAAGYWGEKSLVISH